MGDTNEDLVKRGFEAFGTGDMDTLREIMSPDVVHTLPGDNLVSGEYKGIDEVLGLYGKLFELSDGTVTVDLQSATAKGDDHVIAEFIGRAERNGKSYESPQTIDFTIEGGKAVRLDETYSDQAAADAFWS
jgi:uncharacterized protein